MAINIALHTPVSVVSQAIPVIIEQPFHTIIYRLNLKKYR